MKSFDIDIDIMCRELLSVEKLLEKQEEIRLENIESSKKKYLDHAIDKLYDIIEYGDSSSTEMYLTILNSKFKESAFLKEEDLYDVAKYVGDTFSAKGYKTFIKKEQSRLANCGVLVDAYDLTIDWSGGE